MKLVFEEVLEDPRKYTEELKEIPIPEDLCAQFERQRRWSSPVMSLNSVEGQLEPSVAGRWIWELRAYSAQYTRQNIDPDVST